MIRYDEVEKSVSIEDSLAILYYEGYNDKAFNILTEEYPDLLHNLSDDDKTGVVLILQHSNIMENVGKLDTKNLYMAIETIYNTHLKRKAWKMMERLYVGRQGGLL